jgi:hypothetical protein
MVVVVVVEQVRLALLLVRWGLVLLVEQVLLLQSQELL